MYVHACAGKIHRATVTQAELNYVGSITIDADLLDAAGIAPYQYLNITNLRNGVYWRTYAIAGKRGNGDVCLNGPPAHHFEIGDVIIILAEVLIKPGEMNTLKPRIVRVDNNDIVSDTFFQIHRNFIWFFRSEFRVFVEWRQGIVAWAVNRIDIFPNNMIEHTAYTEWLC